MSDPIFLPILIAGFSVAFLHAAIPTHWLPFVLASRAEKWSKSKTLGITALAGAGHVAITALLGVLVVWFGLEFDKRFSDLFPYLAAGLLTFFGLFYLWRQSRGGGHSHFHIPWFKTHNRDSGCDHNQEHSHSHDHDHDHHDHEHVDLKGKTLQQKSDRWTVLSLIALLTFSPCEGFLPVYLSGVHLGWLGFLALSVVLGMATLCGMMLFTWLTLIGFEKFKLAIVEQYENAFIGTALCLLGIGVLLFEN